VFLLLHHDQLAGPMWSAPMHDANFVEKVLEHLETHQNNYGTSARMKGMLTVAKEVRNSSVNMLLGLSYSKELPNPFYFTTSRMASLFHSRTPSLDDIAYVNVYG
jgi:tRNA (guanine26-N2/guanine27-N2)-dimethyltransferase